MDNGPGGSAVDGAVLETKRTAAWDEFYDHCFRIIRKSPAVRKLSESDREDCVQEVMVEIVRRFWQAGCELSMENVTGLVAVISRNKASDIVRRKYRRPEVFFDDGAGEKLPASGVSEAEADLGRGESVSLVWEALMSLDQEVPVTSYLAFYLRTIDGWSIQEIADLLQITPEQARVRCHRVKKKFESILRTMNRGEGEVPDV